MSVTLEDASEHLKHIGYRNTFASNVILVREALQRGITVTMSSRYSDIQLEHNGKIHRWRSGRNTLNTALAKRVTRYRDASSALLRAQGVRAAENILVAPSGANRAWAWAKPLDAVLLKSNHKKAGAGTFVKITDEESFSKLFQRAASQDTPVLLERFYPGEAHRCFVVKGRVVAAAFLRPTSVTGDGTSTIDSLVKDKNRKRKAYPSHRPLPLAKEEREFLSSQQLTIDSIPADGERVFLSPASSPRAGGDAIDVTDSLGASQVAFVEEAVSAIPGLSIAGVDIVFHPKGEESSSVILKVNASPQISTHHHPWEGAPRDVAAAVLDAMFSNS